MPVKVFYGPIIIVLFTMSSSLLYLRYTQPLFEANAVLLVKAENTSSEIGMGGLANSLAQDDYQKDIQFMKSAIVLDKLVDNLPLQVSYFNSGQILVEERYKDSPFEIKPDLIDPVMYGVPIYLNVYNKKAFEFNYTLHKKTFSYKGYFKRKAVTPYLTFTANLTTVTYNRSPHSFSNQYYFILNSKNQVEGIIRERLKVLPTPPTLLLNYQVREPQRAADIVNGVINEFVEFDQGQKTESSKHIINFIDGQMNVFMAERQVYEDKLKYFKISHGLISTEEEGRKYLIT